MSHTEIKTTAIILSGGAGTRVNGRDKGLQLYQGKALIQHVIDRLEPQVDELHLCANRNLEHYRTLGFVTHQDQLANYQGPMSGITSVLKDCLLGSTADQVLISSCDAPHLPLNLRDKLQAGLTSYGLVSDVAIAHDGERRQNLHCLIRRQAWQSLIDFFDDGGRAMHRWFAEVETADVDFSADRKCFLNINRSEQLE